jgi:nucleoside-diphosphate-sugar epimerase
MARIAIVGAAGYVGQELCRQMKAAGHDVVGIARANGGFILDRLGVAHELPQQAQRVGNVDAVVNLAYPKSPSGFDYPDANREILATLRTLAGAGARVVHASSLAVFGYTLEIEPVPAPLPVRRDYSYIESKLELERLLPRAFPRRDLQIVRLGNIWGPGSPTWTAALADRLLFGEAVGISGVDGYSNATDVSNAASYLAHLAVRPGPRRAEFHHLAEFADVRWSFWLKRLASALKVEAVTAPHAPAWLAGFWEELSALQPVRSPLSMARDIMRGRYVASWAGSILRRLPITLLERLERAAHLRSSGAAASGAEDAAFLSILGTQRQFVPRIDPDWSAPCDAEASWRGVEAWLRYAGYC